MVSEGESATRGGWLKRLYDWVLRWSERPGGTWALFWIAVAESSFFPIPPDVLLIPMCLGSIKRSFWFAAVCTLGSVLGAMLGYVIGSTLFATIGEPILELYGYVDKFEAVGKLYDQNLLLTLGTAGFTPIPFKVFTIAAGAFSVSFPAFVVISAASRAGRFFLVAGLIRAFGESIREFIDKYFNILSIVLVLLIIGGFLAVSFLLPSN